MHRPILCLASVALLAPFASAVNPQAFFEQHCIRCHGEDKQKGKLRLDGETWDRAEENKTELWQEVIDRIDSGEMPPEEEPRPLDNERSDILSHMRTLLSKTTANAKPKQVTLRRLNRVQYRNTIRDLLLLDLTVDDPTEAFPADDKLEGFDNLGEALQMSDFLLRQYLKVARRLVDRSTFAGHKPEPVTYSLRQEGKIRPKNFSMGRDDPTRSYAVLTSNDERAPGDPRGQSLTNCRDGATHDGYYDFTFEVESQGRGNLTKVFGAQRRKDYPVYRPEDLHRFEIYITAPNKSSAVQTRPRTLVHAIDLPDEERVVIKKRIWLPKEWRVEVGFGNGYWGVVDPILLVDPGFDLETFRELPKREQNSRYGKLLIDRFEKVDAPRITIHRAIETGPIYQQWPPASHEMIWGKEGQSDDEIVRAFATRAFRRPVSEEQIAPYLRLVRTSPEGLRSAIEAILCSPRFLYLQENGDELDDYAIASRLSYFLWNTMPDEALLKDATERKLRNPETLAKHLERMLSDPRSDEFVHSFAWSWLHFDNIVEMAPDPIKFYEFHRNRIHEAMIEESRIFFRHLIDENLPVSRFIDADFAFINSNLARHYGLPGKVNTVTAFRKVSLAGKPLRGGLLGQASVLTASANGVDTSPVVRGIWILENLLGTTPDSPPPDLDLPEPDARGELTIRELYAKHRTIQSCNDCHKKIDPLGFALENFDATGQLRTQYESGHRIDSSGRMPDGKTFKDLDGLKKIMAADLRQFSRNLSTKLLTYATGRTMEVSDRPEIDRLVELSLKNKIGLKDLLREVVTSEIFLNK